MCNLDLHKICFLGTLSLAVNLRAVYARCDDVVSSARAAPPKRVTRIASSLQVWLGICKFVLVQGRLDPIFLPDQVGWHRGCRLNKSSVATVSGDFNQLGSRREIKGELEDSHVNPRNATLALPAFFVVVSFA